MNGVLTTTPERTSEQDPRTLCQEKGKREGVTLSLREGVTPSLNPEGVESRRPTGAPESGLPEGPARSGGLV